VLSAIFVYKLCMPYTMVLNDQHWSKTLLPLVFSSVLRHTRICMRTPSANSMFWQIYNLQKGTAHN